MKFTNAIAILFLAASANAAPYVLTFLQLKLYSDDCIVPSVMLLLHLSLSVSLQYILPASTFSIVLNTNFLQRKDFDGASKLIYILSIPCFFYRTIFPKKYELPRSYSLTTLHIHHFLNVHFASPSTDIFQE